MDCFIRSNNYKTLWKGLYIIHLTFGLNKKLNKNNI